MGSLNRNVATMISLQAEYLKNCGSIPGKGKRLSSIVSRSTLVHIPISVVPAVWDPPGLKQLEHAVVP
jgi:hypothetical protein